jgi:DNA polymerase
MRPTPTEAEKESEMAQARDRAAKTAPKVCEPGRQLVWGEGPVNALAAIVGEAPGDREDKLGRPFVGPAGALLDRELARVGLNRGDFWITNVVKCRPTKPEGGRVSNRPPTVKEIRAWSDLLTEELLIVSPRIIVCMGAPAARALIRKDFAITKEHGEWFEGPFGSLAIATYHPAYVLRQMGQSVDRTLVEFRLDLLKVAEAMEEAAGRRPQPYI